MREHYFKSFDNGHITCGCGHLEIHDRSDADVMAAQTRMNDHIRSYYTDAEWAALMATFPGVADDKDVPTVLLP